MSPASRAERRRSNVVRTRIALYMGSSAVNRH